MSHAERSGVLLLRWVLMQEDGGAKDGLFEARPKRRAFAHEGRG